MVKSGLVTSGYSAHTVDPIFFFSTERGTSPKNVSRDSAAIDAFCGLVNKEPNCIPTAAKLIVSKMQSMQEWEALQALQVGSPCTTAQQTLYEEALI